jgi:alanine racemase
VQVKVDTGMGRLGVQPEDAPALIAEVRRRGAHLNLLGIFTHMARADEDSAANAEQLARFGDVLRRIQDLGVPLPRFIHAANSAATLRIGASVRDFSIVRPGINIYGLRYSPETPLAAELQPALRWSTQLSLVKVLPPGSGVSYGHTYVTSKAQRIGTCPIGYGDGYRRSKGNQVLVGGRRVNVLGRVCMDSIMIDLDPVPEARVGDEVVLLGAQGAQQILASELATRWGTIDYEVTCGISPRVPRVYTQELLGPEAAGR